VTGLAVSAFDQALLVPPTGAIERRHCKDFRYAKPVKTPDPLYPRSASENKTMGDTVVSITIETDGSVRDIHLLGGSTQSMDDSTMKTIKGWKFKPATCGNEPVVSDLRIVVSFRLYRRP
jgi:TonB family protein